MSEMTAEQRARNAMFQARYFYPEAHWFNDVIVEIAAAIRSAEMAQMERDAAAVCEWCNHAPGYESAHMKGGEWFHRWRSISHAGVAYCAASPIRAAYAERQKEGAE